MKRVALQITPEVKTAYFADCVHVAEQELLQVAKEVPIEYRKIGSLEFFVLECPKPFLEQMVRLSFVQGVYELDGELLKPLDTAPDFALHNDFVFGSKFRGKTNERLTQLLINVGLAAMGTKSSEGLKLLDPMCGRATTLLWAMRYRMNAKGIEQDKKVLPDIHRDIKKWSKLHRQKHQLTEGTIGAAKSKNGVKFLQFRTENVEMRVAVGDARQADMIFRGERFHLLVSDLPYGVQHTTAGQARNPLNVLKDCVTPWRNCLRQNGVMVLSFNSNNPKREAVIDLFEKGGLRLLPFSAAHRMSESIVRDVVMFQRTENE